MNCTCGQGFLQISPWFIWTNPAAGRLDRRPLYGCSGVCLKRRARVLDAADGFGTPQHDHAFEERRRHGLAGDGHPEGSKEAAYLDVHGIAGGPKSLFQVVQRKRFERFQQLDALFEHFDACRRCQLLADQLRGVWVHNLVGKGPVDEWGGLGQELNAFLDERNQMVEALVGCQFCRVHAQCRCNERQQVLLEGGGERGTCARGNFCCWNRQDVSKLELHKNTGQVLYWNGKEYESSDGLLLSLKLNRFEAEPCDRPLLRTRPLTIYRLVRLLTSQRVIILRAKDLSLARRILAQAFDYMRCRDPSLVMCELEMEREVRVERELFEYLKGLKAKAGTRMRVLVAISEREGSGRTQAYEHFLQNPRLFLENARLVYQLEIALSFVVVAANPSFQGEYPTLHLPPHPHPEEKYYEILHSYRSDHLSPNNPQCWLNLDSLLSVSAVEQTSGASARPRPPSITAANTTPTQA